MNRIIKKLAIILGVISITFSSMASVFAADFIDMPDNWTTGALENAVKNGLLYGEETAEGMKVNPDANITRAQMAAIIVRAFGATETTDISTYTDVDANAWYYNELAKAVKMNAFRGDGNLMNPQNNITFQECFTVVSQVLRLELYTKSEEVLKSFSDYDQVAAWAKPYMTAVVGNGFWDGIDGKLLPTQYITRSQFAVLMDNIVKTYIDEPGEYSEFETGNVMVRCDGVTIKDVNIKGDLIIGDGVSNAGVVLNNTQIDHFLYIRGGGQNVMMENGTTADRSILITPDLTLNIDGTSKNISGSYTCHKTDRVHFTAQFEEK